MKRFAAHSFFLAASILLLAAVAAAQTPVRRDASREICPASGAPRIVQHVESIAPLGLSVDRHGVRAVPAHPEAPASGADPMTRGATPWIDLKGPYSAYVMGLAIDPADPQKLFCTTTAGGVFRSLNGGGSWNAAQSGMYYDWARQVAVDPNNSQVVFCAASSYWRPEGADVYKSTDGGAAWSSCGLTSALWSGVHVCRNDSSVVLAGGDAGIWRSTDGGATWGWVYGSGTVLSFCEDPSQPDTIYAGTYGYGIYRTRDRGVTWEVLTISACGNIRIVAVHGQDSNTIYAAGNPVGIFRSTDGGTSWSNVKTFEAWGVACAPADGDRVYAVGEGPAFTGTPGVFVSEDAGATWTECALPTEHFYAPFAMRAAVHPADPDVAYVGLYRAGVFKTTDGGATWSAANTGLKNCFVEDIVSHPAQPGTVFAATLQAGLYKSTDAGATWVHSDAGWVGAETNRSVNVLAMDPADPNHLLLGGSNSGVFQSFDGGATWSATALQNYAEIKGITFAPSDPSQVWAGSTNSSATLGIWKSTDGGTSWLNKYPGIACYSIAVHPTDPDRVVATTGTWWFEPAQILGSTNGGNTWAQVYVEGFGFVLDSSWSRANTNGVWAVSMYEHVLGSNNGGQTWYKKLGGWVPPGRPFSIVADPTNPAAAYVPLDDDGGFFFTTNYGATWHGYHAGLWLRSLVPLHVGVYPPWPRIFYTGTMGNGAFGAILY